MPAQRPLLFVFPCRLYLFPCSPSTVAPRTPRECVQVRAARPTVPCVAIWALFSDYSCIALVYAEIGILYTSSKFRPDRNIEAASAPVLTASNCFVRKMTEKRGEWLRYSRYNGILNLYFPLLPSSLGAQALPVHRSSMAPQSSRWKPEKETKIETIPAQSADVDGRERAKMKMRRAEGRSCVRRDRSVCVLDAPARA